MWLSSKAMVVAGVYFFLSRSFFVVCFKLFAYTMCLHGEIKHTQIMCTRGNSRICHLATVYVRCVHMIFHWHHLISNYYYFPFLRDVRACIWVKLYLWLWQWMPCTGLFSYFVNHLLLFSTDHFFFVYSARVSVSIGHSATIFSWQVL